MPNGEPRLIVEAPPLWNVNITEYKKRLVGAYDKIIAELTPKYPGPPPVEINEIIFQKGLVQAWPDVVPRTFQIRVLEFAGILEMKRASGWETIIPILDEMMIVLQPIVLPKPPVADTGTEITGDSGIAGMDFKLPPWVMWIIGKVQEVETAWHELINHPLSIKYILNFVKYVLIVIAIVYVWTFIGGTGVGKFLIKIFTVFKSLNKWIEDNVLWAFREVDNLINGLQKKINDGLNGVLEQFGLANDFTKQYVGEYSQAVKKEISEKVNAQLGDQYKELRALAQKIEDLTRNTEDRIIKVIEGYNTKAQEIQKNINDQIGLTRQELEKTRISGDLAQAERLQAEAEARAKQDVEFRDYIDSLELKGGVSIPDGILDGLKKREAEIKEKIHLREALRSKVGFGLSPEEEADLEKYNVYVSSELGARQFEVEDPLVYIKGFYDDIQRMSRVGFEELLISEAMLVKTDKEFQVFLKSYGTPGIISYVKLMIRRGEGK